MKRLLYGLSLAALGSFAFASNANAACGDSGGGNIDPYGTSLNLFVTDGAQCDEYILDTNAQLGKIDTINLITSVPLFGTTSTTVSANTAVEGFSFSIDADTSYTGVTALNFPAAITSVGDTVILSAASGVTSYSGSFEICGNFSSTLSVNSSANTTGMVATFLDDNADVNITFGSYGSDFTLADAVIGGVTYPNKKMSFIPSSTGEQCATANFTVSNIEANKDLEFALILLGDKATVTDNSSTINGTFGGRLAFKTISADVSCTSVSGTESACGDLYNYDGIDPMKCPFGCETSIGNPINFSLGFKHETVTDFASGSLLFKRNYRSDATWYPDSVGQNWRHNYDRSVSSDGTNATVTNEDGLVYTFSKSGGVWSVIADDSNLSATLEEPMANEFIYTSPSDERNYFDTDGKLTRIEYRGGEALNLSYDGSDRLVLVADEQGDDIAFTYSGSLNRIATMSTDDGVYSFSYDVNDNLTSVTKPDTKTLVYHYEDTNFVNALTGITNEKNIRYSTYAYDAQGRAVSSEHAGGTDHYTIAYNADDSVTTTNPLGKDTTYHFETIKGVRKIISIDGAASANCAAASKAYTYDANGWLASKTDWEGNVTSYIRDSRGLVTSMTEGTGSAAARTTTTSYDPVYRLPNVITETGLTTDYDYDVHGRMILETLTDTATSETRITAYTYNANTVDGSGNTVLGKLATIDGARTDVTDVTTFLYDTENRLIKTTDALGYITEITSYDASDRILTMEDQNGIETAYTYDALGRVLSLTEGNNVAALKNVTTYQYNADGALSKTTFANGVYHLNYYNADGRKRLMRNALNGTWWFFDNAGNVTLETRKRIAAGTSNTYVHYKTYDELSRKISDRDHPGNKTLYSYDLNSNMMSKQDANLNTTSYGFDSLDRQTSETDALSGVTSYGLNELNQKESATDPRSNSTTYTYNAFGDVLSEVSPDRGTITYVVDKSSNVTSMTDARSIVTNYAYDALNRVSSVSYPSDSSLNQSFTYDSAAVCGSGIGRLCSVIDASGTTSYVYDALGRLTDVTETRGLLSFATSYSYDVAGNLIGMTLPSGRVITYTLDANGDVDGIDTVVNGSNVNVVDNVEYLAYGPVSNFDYGNGLALTNTYNIDHELLNRQIGSLMNEAYSYDATSKVTAKGSTAYSYDALNRLVTEDSDSYTYDAIGNRLSDTSNSYIYPSSSSVLSSINAMSITTDSAGNITQDASRSYVIDAAGHVKEVKIGGATVGSYVYDASNHRTQKTTSSVTTQYVYGAGGLLSGEYDATGVLIREYVYLNGEPVAQVDGSAIMYLLTDHLGTPRIGINSSGSSVWDWTSDAFGNGAPTGSETVNLRFAGQYYDGESGLHYNWNRYYDPSTGRYVSSDPIGLDGGRNTFAYVGSNPVMLVDPEGKNAVLGAGLGVLGACIRYPSACTTVLGAAAAGVTGAAAQKAKEIFDDASSNSDAEKRADRARYHKICDTPPPPTGDLCKDAKAEVDWHKSCIDARVSFTKKWYDGKSDSGHTKQINEKRSAMKNAQKRVKAACPPEQCEE